MASQPANSTLGMAQFDSYIRGYHAYLDTWTPVVGETLLLKREPSNEKDSSVIKEDIIVGHVPYNIASVIFQFLRRDCNKEVTGSKVNRGAGYGLEIPSTYRLYGPRPYTDRVQQIADTLHADGYYS